MIWFLFIGVAAYLLYHSIQQKRNREAQERFRAEQERQRVEQSRIAAELIEQHRAAQEEAKRIARMEREQLRQAQEQERQAALLAKHEAAIMKLEGRLYIAEGEIAHSKEQQDALYKLLCMAEEARDACANGSAEWQKRQKKVLSLENQVYNAQKRHDKAMAEKRFCEQRLSA